MAEGGAETRAFFYYHSQIFPWILRALQEAHPKYFPVKGQKKAVKKVVSSKLIPQLIIEKEKFWTSTLWAISKGDKTQYDALLRTNAVEFFYLLKRFEESIKAK